MSTLKERQNNNVKSRNSKIDDLEVRMAHIESRVFGPESEDDKAYIYVTNNTSTKFTYLKKDVDYGKTEDGPYTIEPLVAMFEAYKAEGASGSATGTNGYVEWNEDGDTDSYFKVDFDCPYSKDNSGSVSGSDDFDKKFKVSAPKPDTSGSCNMMVTIEPA